MKLKAKVFIPVLIVVIACMAVYIKSSITSGPEHGIMEKILEACRLDSGLEGVSVSDVNIEETVAVENHEIVLFSVYSAKFDYRFTGIALFKKGINGNSSLEYFSQDTGLYKGQVLTMDKSRYLVLYGSNYKGVIAEITAVAENKEYQFNVHRKDKYIVCFALDQSGKNPGYNHIDWKIYDENNRDITKWINDEYFGNVLKR